jgi:hypothetical protein
MAMSKSVSLVSYAFESLVALHTSKRPGDHKGLIVTALQSKNRRWETLFKQS